MFFFSLYVMIIVFFFHCIFFIAFFLVSLYKDQFGFASCWLYIYIYIVFFFHCIFLVAFFLVSFFIYKIKIKLWILGLLRVDYNIYNHYNWVSRLNVMRIYLDFVFWEGIKCRLILKQLFDSWTSQILIWSPSKADLVVKWSA